MTTFDISPTFKVHLGERKITQEEWALDRLCCALEPAGAELSDLQVVDGVTHVYVSAPTDKAKFIRALRNAHADLFFDDTKLRGLDSSLERAKYSLQLRGQVDAFFKPASLIDVLTTGPLPKPIGKSKVLELSDLGVHLVYPDDLHTEHHKVLSAVNPGNLMLLVRENTSAIAVLAVRRASDYIAATWVRVGSLRAEEEAFIAKYLPMNKALEVRLEFIGRYFDGRLLGQNIYLLTTGILRTYEV